MESFLVEFRAVVAHATLHVAGVGKSEHVVFALWRRRHCADYRTQRRETLCGIVAVFCHALPAIEFCCERVDFVPHEFHSGFPQHEMSGRTRRFDRVDNGMSWGLLRQVRLDCFVYFH
jgi:hypothetical protein